MEESQTKENRSEPQVDITELKASKPSRHVSVLYGVQYLSKVPMVKRCRKTEKDCFADINKKQIFGFVFNFVQRIMSDREFLQSFIKELEFGENQVSTTRIEKEKVAAKKKCSILGENLQNRLSAIGEDYIIHEQKCIIDDRQSNCDSSPGPQGDFLCVKPSKSMKNCKISIMMDEFCFDQSVGDIASECSSALFSDESISEGISSINIVEQEFNLKMIEKIYEQPEPFLINLSVCLMLKFLQQSMKTLNKSNVCWILSTATIVAYKLYYDEPVEGLVESFASILKISRGDIVNLERTFLGSINHEAVISNKQYHSVLYQIIKQG